LWDAAKICEEDKDLLIANDEWDELNAIDCDTDGDGKKDIMLGGDRGFVYLTGDNTPIQDIVNYGATPDMELEDHMWVPGKDGDVAVAISAMMSPTVGLPYPGQVVKVPVFNKLCDIKGGETEAACVSFAHGTPWNYAGDCDEDAFDETNNENLYHILAFADFYVSCVSTKGGCPGYQYAVSTLAEEE